MTQGRPFPSSFTGLLPLSLGADPDVRDARFDSTPLGWARHVDQPAVAEILAPVTADEPARAAPA
jgi:hypothetical protein